MWIKKYWIDIVYTLLAIIPVLISLFYDMHLEKNTYFWFQRSGSLMVLFGVMLDFEQTKYSGIEESKHNFVGDGTPQIIAKHLPKERLYIKRFSIVLIIIGTFIWGYGDLLFKFLEYFN